MARVGVCLTVIGLVRFVIAAHLVDTMADDLLLVDALLFLASCLSSDWALRTRHARRRYHLERMADGIFISALVFMAFICAFVTYRVTTF